MKIGNFKTKLDDKGRMTIASKFREELGQDIVISLGFNRALEIRTVEEYSVWLNSLIEKGNLNSAARELRMIVAANSFDLTIDKSGRINVPNDLIEKAGIEKEVYLVGVGDKIEIHSAEGWAKYNSDGGSLSNKMEELAELLAE